MTGKGNHIAAGVLRQCDSQVGLCSVFLWCCTGYAGEYCRETGIFRRCTCSSLKVAICVAINSRLGLQIDKVGVPE
jgi:hypothetical protein